MLGLKEADLDVPDDISVIGFDDLPFSTYSNPPLPPSNSLFMKPALSWRRRC
nr:substrate-binding domain-containing protein [Klebsiella pneumoniae]